MQPNYELTEAGVIQATFAFLLDIPEHVSMFEALEKWNYKKLVPCFDFPGALAVRVTADAIGAKALPLLRMLAGRGFEHIHSLNGPEGTDYSHVRASNFYKAYRPPSSNAEREGLVSSFFAVSEGNIYDCAVTVGLLLRGVEEKRREERLLGVLSHRDSWAPVLFQQIQSQVQ